MDELKGIGHFTIWFLLGFMIFRIVLKMRKESLAVNLYGPFIPFVLGVAASMPYLLATLGIVSDQQIATQSGYNAFLFYVALNDLSLVVRIFSNFHIAVAADGIAYLSLLLHYIRLVRKIRGQYAK